MSEIKGYKVFNSDWTCKGFQYEVGKSYEMEEPPIICEKGFHFCEKLIDCYDYYGFDSDNKVAEVIAYGDIDVEENGKKSCTNKIKIEREICWYEVIDMVNVGKKCTGLGNNGDHNSGDYNSGYYNSGDHNSGDHNSGDHNSGDYNSGDHNSGYWNATNYSSGCFNTAEQKIFLFNTMSDWTMKDWMNSEARRILNNIEIIPIQKIDEKDMTESEKEQHTEYKTKGFYLKVLSLEEMAEKRQQYWNGLSQEKKEVVMAIPNFDKEIFKEITGIDVEK